LSELFRDRVGFIGLGAMGWPMAARLRLAGFDLVVHDIDARRANSFVGAHGGMVASNARTMANQCWLIFIMLPDSPHVEQACFGEEGIVQGVKASDSEALDGNLIVVNCATIDPDISRDLTARAGAVGFRMMEAPVARGVPGAKAGDLAFFVGGEGSDLANAMPCFQAMGTDIHHTGPVGTGMGVKMINNALSVSTTALVAEAMALAKKLGLDRSRLLDYLHNCNGDSYTLRLKVPKIEANDFESGFSVDLAHKDISIILSLAERLNCDMPISETARKVMEITQEAGYGGKDTGAVYLLYED